MSSSVPWRRSMLAGEQTIARRRRRQVLALAQQIARSDIRRLCKEIEGDLIQYELLLPYDTLQDATTTATASPQAPQIRSKLGPLIDALSSAKTQLEHLDDVSRADIVFSYVWGRQRSIGEDIAAIGRLLVASRRAREALPRGGGAKGRPSLLAVVQWLAERYERATAERFSVGAGGEAFNRSAAWVAETIRIVTPGIEDATLRTAFKSVKRSKVLPNT